MILEELTGKIFQANDLYEILHFDIEQNFENYVSKFIHIYFEQLGSDRVQISEIVYFPDEDTLYVTNRAIVGVKGWFEIYEHSRHINLLICKQDRSGKFSTIGPSLNYTQAFFHKNYDLHKEVQELTPEEIKQAFTELAGLFGDKLPSLKSKVAV